MSGLRLATRVGTLALAGVLACGPGPPEGRGTGEDATEASSSPDTGEAVPVARDTISVREERMTETPDRSIHEVLEAHREDWMVRPEVTGTGIGRCDEQPCIVVYLLRSGPDVEAALPDTVEGYPVRLEVTGRVEPRDGGG